MKILGWMHRKLRQNTSHPFNFKDFAVGFDETNMKAGRDTFRPSRTSEDRTLCRSLGVYAGEHDEDTFSDILEGLLAIGTLGFHRIQNGGPTSDNVLSTEKELEVAEDDLKLINEEIEKVLSKEELLSETPSPINGNHTDKTVDHESNICLHQGCRVASANESTSKNAKGVVPMVKHRPSLGELFSKSKNGKDTVKSEKVEKNDGEKPIIHLLKNILKRRTLVHRSSRHNYADSVSLETKIHKILRIFHRKIHPDFSDIISKKPMELDKNMLTKSESMDYQSPDDDEDAVIIPNRFLREEGVIQRMPNRKQQSVSSNDTNGCREHWIKTDADYFVLEL